ncbi:protein cueball [Anastrepha obliqua]|uniref:protein cueball n=1 Tax=Anastrepha obliqua TaxID=95512 RepID=UPI002409326C|nr:protein cueball [Anastrepha obliqua]
MMLNLRCRIFYALLLYINTTFAWDFAVTTPSKIIFYDEHWSEVTSSAHKFQHLGALTFDEAEEKVYFTDEQHHNVSIFSLTIPKDYEDPHLIEKMVQRTKNEAIRSIAYDPLDRKLYWSDILNKKILMVSVDANDSTTPNVFIDFTQEDTLPDGIAIDFCRRLLYWTNSNFSNSSIERIGLDGKNRKLIVRGNMFAPHGIIVDQLTDRIYYVVAQQGIHFSVESANLDGSDRKVIMKGLNNEPFSLAVTKNAIFWTDHTNRAIWGHAKFANDTESIELDAGEQEEDDGDGVYEQKAGARMVLQFDDKPRGIVARVHYLTNSLNDQHCHEVLSSIKNRVLTKSNDSVLDVHMNFLRKNYCLNGGEFVPQTTRCICKIGFKGARCETNECLNYCMHGTCVISSLGLPTCECPHSFYGSRCQERKCAGHCLNDGRCVIEDSGEPSCECKDNFGGARCEHNSTEICALYCKILKLDADAYVPFGCHDICEELAQQSDYGAETYAIPKYPHLEMCEQVNPWSNTVIIVIVCGVVASLGLMVLMVHGLRRFYKPARPRIKKTFVVRKQAARSTDTPLTNRPVATEQCEITIENCCNMNICDTPCFDSKLLEKTLSCNSKVKEDKKMLINSMDDELY